MDIVKKFVICGAFSLCLVKKVKDDKTSFFLCWYNGDDFLAFANDRVAINLITSTLKNEIK